jgi:hypothetical protein
MPARKLNPVEKEAKKPNPLPSREEETAFSSAMNEYLEELKKPTLNSWDKAIIIPFFIPFAVFGILEQYTDVKVFEAPDNETVLSTLLAIFFFGFLMSVITNARQGRVLGRLAWIKRAKRPKTFFFVLAFYVGFAFVICTHALHTVLASLF